MIEAVVLFLLGIGSLLVSIASILRMAWLAVIIPMVIAGAAAYWVFSLSRRGPRRAVDRAMRAKKTDTRMAA